MAASDIDQKVLARIAKETSYENPLLSSALYQVLGISILLSRKLYRARRLRRLDPTRETKSISLYHHIIWLSREGLTIVEVLILPYCQNGGQGPHCRVMAAKLRASFFHVFCLFHNNPPISQMSPTRTSPPGPLAVRAGNGQTIRRLSPNNQAQERRRKAALRDAIPSIASESSYVTNPFAATGPARSSPPLYPLPPTPTTPSPARRAPMRPPGLNIPSPAQRSPPSKADFLLPPINFVPLTSGYFTTASNLAKSLLPGSDPLRLSVALEFCAFLRDCAKDNAAAREGAKTTLYEVYVAPEGMDDAEFQDAAILVSAITIIAQIEDTPSSSNDSLTKSPRIQPTPSSPTGKASSTKASSRKRAARDDEDTKSRSPASLRPRQRAPVLSSEAKSVSNSTEGQSATMVNSPATESSSKGKSGSASSSRPGSDKERKRRLLERAEQEYMRRNSTKGTSSGRDSRQTAPPQVTARQQRTQR